MRGLGAGGDDHLVGAHAPFCAGVVAHHHLGRLGEARVALEERHMVAQELVADDAALALDDLARPQREILDPDLLLEPVVLAVDAPLAEAGQVQDGLADGLRGDRAGVDGDPAEMAPPLDERDPLAQLRGLNGRSLPGRARPMTRSSYSWAVTATASSQAR